ncbi:Undecaprenyl-phosphate mannosyltransferase [Gimesia fumaroli]|uniref:Undecaprenyl-phosphate mannosyltransferase n=2 Tax=Gimesia fumaroli TaxID=2527976 RepID=A0A518IDS0_9PLAN|nr:Undecaprenyl-phosphate mannosyltransferase [Gimesia fumaroli]
MSISNNTIIQIFQKQNTMPEIIDCNSQTHNSPLDLTILLPAYNEENAIESLITEIRNAMTEWSGNWEILVIDDCSSDNTAAKASLSGVRLVKRVENGGSGASRKTGIRESHGELIAMLDADGSYDPSSLPELLSYFPDYDQVNGARTSEQGTIKFLRVPIKWSIRKLAEIVSGKRIPDLNTGLKIFKRDLMRNYLWAIPDGFSCVTSMTLAFMCNGHSVKYIPVTYRKRIGKSKFHPIHDTLQYFLTVLRIITYFRPLRVLAPLAFSLGAIGVLRASYHIFYSPDLGITDSDVILIVAGLMILIAGMLADLIVKQRQR